LSALVSLVPEKRGDKIGVRCNRRRVALIRDTNPSRTVVMAGPGKPGPKSKGPWRHLSAKIPTPIADAVDAEAKRRGVKRTVVLTEILAAQYGLPVSPTQESLPLNDAA
jgi:hypothetical protein